MFGEVAPSAVTSLPVVLLDPQRADGGSKRSHCEQPAANLPAHGQKKLSWSCAASSITAALALMSTTCWKKKRHAPLPLGMGAGGLRGEKVYCCVHAKRCGARVGSAPICMSRAEPAARVRGSPPVGAATGTQPATRLLLLARCSSSYSRRSLCSCRCDLSSSFFSRSAESRCRSRLCSCSSSFWCCSSFCLSKYS